MSIGSGVAYGMNQEHLLKTLESFGFEGLDETMIQNWLDQYPDPWAALAVVEAVYQGRYKMVSVEQILRCWQRRGEPRTNFDQTFARQILDRPWQPLRISTPETAELAAPLTALPRLGQRPVVHRLRELIGVA